MPCMNALSRGIRLYQFGWPHPGRGRTPSAKGVEGGSTMTLENNHSDPDSDFSVVRVSHSGSKTAIALAGELDVASAPTLQGCLSETAAAGAETIELDLGRLAYIDSAGLGVLVSAHKRFESSGASLIIRQPNKRVRVCPEFGCLLT